MVTFKNVEESDREFMERLYRTTREDELRLTNWPEEQKNAFSLMQLTAQLAHYKNAYKGATHQIILYKKQAAGRLYLWENEKEIRVVDISILPEFQGKGIGKKIFEGLIKTSEEKNKMITLHVIVTNPALKFYEKLGFKHISDDGYRQYMERQP